MIQKIVFLSLTLLLISCIKEIPIATEAFAPEYIVQGMLEANKPISVKLSQTISIYDTAKTNLVTDTSLTLFLFENDVEIDEIRNSGGWFYSQYPAKPGSNYSIFLDLPEEQQITAETQVPSIPPIIEGEFTAGKTFNEYGEALTDCFIEITDISENQEYYYFYIGDSIRGYFEHLSYWYFWNLNDPVLVNEGILDYEPSYFVFADELFIGQSYTINLKYYRGYWDNGLAYIPHQAYCYYSKISEEYYLFLKSLIRHSFNQQNLDVDVLDPTQFLLKGQPVDLYSNVEGAHGVFVSSYSVIKEFVYNPDL